MRDLHNDTKHMNNINYKHDAQKVKKFIFVSSFVYLFFFYIFYFLQLLFDNNEKLQTIMFHHTLMPMICIYNFALFHIYASLRGNFCCF
jgi:hypothetical protein